MVKRLIYPNISWWNCYRKVNRLVKEGFLLECTVEYPKTPVFQLSKKGFNYIKYDLGELTELRFNPQSVNHDYWATAFQLGPFLYDDSEQMQFFTEQQVQCMEKSLLPNWIPKSREHIPDGFSVIQNGDQTRKIAIEIELNLKAAIRYDRAGYYFDSSDSEIDVIFWLCANFNIAKNIFGLLKEANIKRLEAHHFFLMEDFLDSGVNMTARSGEYKNKTLHEILTINGYTEPAQNQNNLPSTELRENIFSPLKIPMNQRSSWPSHARRKS